MLLPRQRLPQHLERRERRQAADLDLEARLGGADRAGEDADGGSGSSSRPCSELAGFREGPRGDLGGPLGEEGRGLGLGAEPVLVEVMTRGCSFRVFFFWPAASERALVSKKTNALGNIKLLTSRPGTSERSRPCSRNPRFEMISP